MLIRFFKIPFLLEKKKTPQKNIHNLVSKLRLVLQSNLFEPGVIILCSNGKRKKADLVIETMFKVINRSTIAAFSKHLFDMNPIKY